MKALIDPAHLVSYISQWAKINGKYWPNIVYIPNSARVCQVEPDDQTFGVADPEFWESCPSEIIADHYYFDMQTRQYILIPPSAPQPKDDQPESNGTQTI